MAESPKWADELYAESDRGCALIAAAYLDDLLLALLRKALVDDRKAFEELVGANRPLGSFSSRITVANCLGLLSPQVHRDLNRVRRIRNGLAHCRAPVSFEDQSVSDLCSQLETWMIPPEIPVAPQPTRNRFILTVGFLSTYLFMRARETHHPKIGGHIKLGDVQIECLDDESPESDR